MMNFAYIFVQKLITQNKEFVLNSEIEKMKSDNEILKVKVIEIKRLIFKNYLSFPKTPC